MILPEQRAAVGLLPAHVSPKEAETPAGQPIGPDRPLTVFEEIDMLAAGKTRKDIATMTPEALETLADAIVSQSDKFLGS